MTGMSCSTPQDVAPPTDAPRVTSTFVFRYGETQNNLTMTVKPWPSGIGVNLAFPPDNQQSTTFCPDHRTYSWGTESVIVSPDRMEAVVGTKTHNLVTPLDALATTGPSPNNSFASPSSITSTNESTSISFSAGTAPPTPTMPAVTSDESGISNGAVAGVAIGCLLFGVLMAGLISWFCCGKRRGRHVQDSEVSAVALISPEKGALSKTRSLYDRTPLWSGTNTLVPQPLEDQAIAGEMSKIGNSIKNHVQSYYHNKAVTPGVIEDDDLTMLGRNLPIPSGTLSTLIDNKATREVALRFCIAWTIVGRLQNYSNSSQSLLPPELCDAMREIGSMDRNNKGQWIYAPACLQD